MTTTFPLAVDTFTTKVDNVTQIVAAHVNDLQDSTLALENFLFGGGAPNLLYHTMSHDIWFEGTTLADRADDSYVASLWNHVQNGQAPDLAGTAGGSTDPFARYMKTTFDSASSQNGFVQFLLNKDTVPLRGKTLSLSAELWGTNVGTLRMAVLEWAGTADTVTSDVVGTWGAGNPTLATNWTYIGTPTAITISSTRTRYKVEGLAVSSTTNNLAVFIWTDAVEASTDVWNFCMVKLEARAKATPFVALPFSGELAAVNSIVQQLDPSSVTSNWGFGYKFSATLLFILSKLDVPMWKPPGLTHNVTGYLNNNPTTTLVALVNVSAGGFYAITGALTFALSSANKQNVTLVLTAGTSWDGTAGNLVTMRIGPDCVILLDARL